jgi:hypothetical protein
MVLRVVALTGERAGLSRLGTPHEPLAGAAIAYGAGAAVLWVVELVVGGLRIEPAAVWSGVWYAASFLFYAWGLALAPVSVVGAWPAATALMLWLAAPEGGVAALAAVVAMVAGAVLTTAGGGRRYLPAIAAMLISDSLLVVARQLDAAHIAGNVWAYAATVYGVVAVLFLAGGWATGGGPTMWRQLVTSPWWSAGTGLANGGAYLALVVLLQYWPPYLVEALSGTAGLASVVSGIWWLGDGGGPARVWGAALVAGGAAALVLQGRGL